MHIHKINSNLQEHQSFLAQNRKDPITGDSISEGDEVVFCAGCKSVFLRDTWEYLGSRHCEQSGTLIDFPLNYKLDLVSKEGIFFHTHFFGDDESNSFLNKLNTSMWRVKKSAALESYYILNGLIITVIVSISVTIFVMFMAIIWAFFIGILFSSVTITFSIWYYFKYFKQSSISSKKNKEEKEFFFSKTGIGFSIHYGLKRFFLDAEYIESLQFRFNTGFFSPSYCIINYFNKTQNKFPITNFFKQKKDKEFLNALKKLSSNLSIQIYVTVNQNSIYQSAIDF
ncbi:hypothetical protein V9L05_00810 [Bernardetia sp. Wsw4-3y2]|uniref:hypothetical protein n=1 Tax=Bernardetia sp. Wsw4-3y2 TaxID=3127471 RepID=UPI0030D4E9BC